INFVTGVDLTRQVILNNGNIGFGTSTPFAQLSVATPNGATGSLSTLFAIASSTQAGATTTLFQVNNTGRVGVGSTTPDAAFSISSTESKILAISRPDASGYFSISLSGQQTHLASQ